MADEFKSFYKKGNRKVNTWCTWNDRLDPYGCGCAHDCSYCYAKALLDFRGLWHPDAPTPASPMQIRRTLHKMKGTGKVLRIGGMTDPFQPAELTQHVTYSLIRQLNVHRIPYLLVTKSDLVASDAYIGIMDRDLAHIQVTITSTDDALAATYEPGAPAPSRRIAAVERLQALGFDVQVRLSPFIPEYVDLDVINAIKCDKILIEFLKVSPPIKKWFKIDYSPYTLKCGGYQHLPLARKIALVDKITGYKERSVGEFVPEHHAYFSTHVNANPDDCCNLRLNKDQKI